MNEEDIWREYRRTRDDALRNQLVVSYLWMVKYLAGRLALRLLPSMCQDDLESCGIFGLMEAVQKYNPDIGVDFEAYAYRRIRGSMIDEIRKANWVPRTMWQRLQNLKQVKEKLEREGRLSEAALTEETGMTVHELRKLDIHYHRAFTVSLDENLNLADGDSVKMVDLVQDRESLDPLEMITEKESQKLLMKAIQTLPEKEQLLLALYYQEGLTLKEIGLVLEVSESRVCQLHGKSITKLRKAMT